MNTSDSNTVAIEAAVFRRLIQHLMQDRPDVQNIDLMILAGFCRNCLSDWYQQAAEGHGVAMTRDEARDAVYGMPFGQWKAMHQEDATPEQLAAFEAARRKPDGA
ncbi:MAG: cell division protein DedD [Xanthomonadaceae bacterium]|nr:cell division protein DedD [Xanthomonadaceae bacterium]